MRSKKKIGLSALGGVLLAVTAFSAYHTYDAYVEKEMENDLLLENAEALAQDEGPRPPGILDFINNYEVAEKIPVTTSECNKGTIHYKGVTIEISNCKNYSYVIYHWCYDGGDRNECIKSHVDSYI